MKTPKEMEQKKEEIIKNASMKAVEAMMEALEQELDTREWDFWEKGEILLDDSKYTTLVDNKLEEEEKIQREKTPNIYAQTLDRVRKETSARLKNCGWRWKDDDVSRDAYLIPYTEEATEPIGR